MNFSIILDSFLSKNFPVLKKKGTPFHLLLFISSFSAAKVSVLEFLGIPFSLVYPLYCATKVSYTFTNFKSLAFSVLIASPVLVGFMIPTRIKVRADVPIDSAWVTAREEVLIDVPELRRAPALGAISVVIFKPFEGVPEFAAVLIE